MPVFTTERCISYISNATVAPNICCKTKVLTWPL